MGGPTRWRAVVVIADVLATYLAAAAENRCVTHGPCPAADAAQLAAEVVTARAAGAPVAVTSDDPLVDDVARHLRGTGVAIVTPDDPAWPASIGTVGAGVTGARLAVAETGTVVVVAGAGAPRSTSIVPPAHVCLLRSGDVVETFGDAIDRLAFDPPSVARWIGGPSRTSDLEMQLTIGIHGPRTVDVVVVVGAERAISLSALAPGSDQCEKGDGAASHGRR